MKQNIFAACLAFVVAIGLIFLGIKCFSVPHMVQTAPAPPTQPYRSTPETRQAYDAAMAEWSAGRQVKAQDLLASDVTTYPNDQRLAFFNAACVRSRWDIAGARPLLLQASQLQSGTADGLCATYVANIDQGTDITGNFNNLTSLANTNRSDVLILWMLAVECRRLEQDYRTSGTASSAANFGIQCYRVLLSRIHGVGPSLVHQTYGNLLDDMGHTELAVVQRRIAVQEEPATWSCSALVQDLDSLGLTSEAAQDRIRYAAYLRPSSGY
jgi:hypothetical protein